MVFRSLFKLVLALPKLLSVGILACIWCYFTGVSHGRAPALQLALVQKTAQKYILKNMHTANKNIQIRGAATNELLKNIECYLDDDAARSLSSLHAD